MALRLGLDLCIPHRYQWGAQVDPRGIHHSFVCKEAPGKASRHHALNHVVARAFSTDMEEKQTELETKNK